MSAGEVAEAIEIALEKARALADEINRGKGGREVALAITKLQEALHWLAEAG